MLSTYKFNRFLQTTTAIQIENKTYYLIDTANQTTHQGKTIKIRNFMYQYITKQHCEKYHIVLTKIGDQYSSLLLSTDPDDLITMHINDWRRIQRKKGYKL